MDEKRARTDADDHDADTEPAAKLSRTATTPLTPEPHADAAVEVVLVEPFHGGSHKQLIDLLVQELLEPRKVRYAVCALPPRKWHWRLMAASMHFASAIPRSGALRVLFVTSMVNLAELLGLRPDLSSSRVRKILYFHENQLTYPFQLASQKGIDSKQQRKVAAEDFQIGWAQIVSCVAADELLFNSDFNRSSFLDKVDAFINKIPEPELRSRGLAAQLRAKSRVLYFPLTIPPLPTSPRPTGEKGDNTQLTVLWNHRWEYDKNPDEFFETLLELEASGARFRVIVLGEAFNQSPPVFETAKATLEASPHVTILHWGYAESKAQYFELLRQADVVVSTSLHEFYGVAVLEAVLCGCYPLVPNRLVYPEFFSGANLFNTQRQLFKKLKGFCSNPHVPRKLIDDQGHDFTKFTWSKLKAEYESMLLGTESEGTLVSVPLLEPSIIK